MRTVPASVREILVRLDSVDEAFTEGNSSTHFISVEKARGPTLAIKGNVEGLIHLAKQILKVASSGVVGHHYHLDEAGMADRCDEPVAFVLARAEWDS